MANKTVSVQFKHNVSPAGLADELTAIKTSIMLISAKLPASSNPQEICDSLRHSASPKCIQMAEIIEMAISLDHEQ